MTPTRIKNQSRKTNPAPFRVAVLEHADSEALLGMLGRCSPTSLHRRFHGVTNGIFYAQQVLAAAGGRDSYVAWIGKKCVGLGNLHVCDDTSDVGVLVEDDWQRRGVGTALLIALVHRVRECGSHFLRADVLEENRCPAGAGSPRTGEYFIGCRELHDVSRPGGRNDPSPGPISNIWTSAIPSVQLRQTVLGRTCAMNTPPPSQAFAEVVALIP